MVSNSTEKSSGQRLEKLRRETDIYHPATFLFTLSTRYCPGVGYVPDKYPLSPWHAESLQRKGIRKTRIKDLKREADRMLIRYDNQGKLRDFLESATRVLYDRLNNNVLKFHSINLGSTNPTLFCGFLLAQDYEKVSFRTKRVLIDNQRVKSPFVVITFTKLPDLFFDYKEKSFELEGVPHINKYVLLKFTVDSYGRIQVYFEQKSLALVDDVWEIVP